MSCSVAVSNSPVFSPSSSLFCNKPSIMLSSPETLTLTLAHLKPSQSATASSSSSAASSPTASSPSSPFRLRIPKPPTGLSASSSGSASPSTVFKRKRPGRLDIPVASFASCAPPATPCTASAWRETVEVEGNGYSVYCKRGRREAMEDRYSAALNLHGDSKQAFFGVFDGHGGAKAAQFAADNLEKNILEETATKKNDDDSEIIEAVKQGYLITDSDFLKEDSRGGSCCVTALISKGNLVISNAGDCRAVVSLGGSAVALTSDHRPSREDERERIESLGGYVDKCRGVWRIQGSLAVSRGIGDRHLKQWVTAEPETKVVKIEPHHEFLILASDGLWDKVSNQEAVDTVRPLFVGVDKAEPLFACKKLVELAASRGSFDDISVMLVQLGRYI